MTTCVECGHSISEHASACPKCKWQCVKCFLCEEPVKKSEHYQPHVHRWLSDPAYHRDCFGAHFQIPPSVACPDCGVSLSETRLAETLSTLDCYITYLACPECGFPNPLQRTDSCSSCGLGIFKSFQTELKSIFLGSGSYHPRSFHDFCLLKLTKLRPDDYQPVQK